MSLSPGERVGSFQILASIGAGGMGVVYRAHDVRLRRDVALKLLPEEFARDGERLARFNREAQLLASLNHANVAAIYGLEEAAGAPVLVLELVEGPTLQDRLMAGRLPRAEAIAIALQLCDALEAAHTRGVVHRDLKPANVKLTADGGVKVLDFGLAKALGEEPIADATSSPTLGAAASRLGVLIGTPAYMSPEQAKGRAVDRRADVWAFGCVLFEMLSGNRAFDAETLSEVLVQVLERDPDWTRLPADLPSGVARVVRRCLAKDPRRRFHDMADVRLDLDEERSEPRGVGIDAEAGLPSRRRVYGWAALAALLGAAATLGLVGLRSPRQAPRRVAAQIQIELPPGVQLAVDTEHPVLALSPDGAQLVFVGSDQNGTRRLYLRRLADREPRPIPGTDGAASPFFSPDGAWIAYYAAEGGLAKVRIASGLPTRILETNGFAVAQGATWGPQDTVVIAASVNSGLARASLSGDRLQPITAAQFVTAADLPYAWPHALPDGRHVLFTDKGGARPRVAVLDLETRGVRGLVDGGTSPRYSPSGHFMFARDGALYAVPVDAAGTVTTGPERKLLEGLMTHADGAAQFSVAADGTLAYVAGGQAVGTQDLVWVDRQGKVAPLLEGRTSFIGPKLSPDGRWLAVASYDGPNLDVWRYDLARGALSRVTTHSGEDFTAVWSPDGSRLALASEIGEDSGEMGPALAWVGDGRPEQLLRSPGMGNWEFPTSWSPDGAWIAFTRVSRAPPSTDVFLFPTRGPRQPVALLDTPDHELGAAFSPDGRFVAFVAHRSEHDEVYVTTFPRPGPWIQISTAGGVEPVWSRDGGELFYREGSRLMAVTLPARSPEKASAPRALFEGPFVRTGEMGGGMANYDVSLDGRRFVMVRRKAGVPPRSIQLVLNWPAALAASSDGSNR